MARSISFRIEGEVDTLVTVTEQPDGTLRFELSVISGTIGDLRAVFFDLNGITADDSLHVAQAVDVTDTSYEEGSVDTLGKDANIKGSVSNELGDFDVGIEFGTSGAEADDIQSTSFVLGSTSEALTLEALGFADFGLRYTSVGEEGGDRTGSAKIGDTSGGTASNDAILVAEDETASVDLLANDGAVGTVISRTVTLENANGVYGTLTILSDGTATVTADGSAADAMNDGDRASFSVTYEVADADDRATASLTVTIEGRTDQTLLPLFTEGDDVVDFRTLEAGVYDPETFYDALGGNDRIYLPDAARAAELGFDLSRVLFTGDGRDVVFGSVANDLVEFGGAGTYVDIGGDDVVVGGTALLSVQVEVGGQDSYAFGDGRDQFSFIRQSGGVVVDLVSKTVSGAAGNGNFTGSGSFTGTVSDLNMSNGDDMIHGTDEPSPFSNFYNFTLYDGNDAVVGGAANETVFLQFGTGTGHKTLDMGGGKDILSFNAVTADMVIDAAAGTYSGWGTGTFSGVEELQLGNGNNDVTGSELRETIRVRLGDDTVKAMGGNDLIYDGLGNSLIDAGAGNDLVVASTGMDALAGGAGYDSLFLTGNGLSGGVHLDLGAGILTAASTSSTVTGFEDIRDGLGDDTLIGSDGDDFLRGEYGNNTLTGGLGADTFWFIPTGSLFGDNIVTDFDAAQGDRLQYFGGGYVREETQVGDDVLVSFSDGSGNIFGTVTLLDTTLDALV